MEAAEQAFLAARKEARDAPESKDQPADTEVVNKSDEVKADKPVEDVVDTEAPATNDTTPSAEESNDIEETPGGSQLEDLFADYNGQEINLREAVEWKESHTNIKSMQADCTRKWQEASELKKGAEELQTNVTSQHSKLSEQLLTLEALIAEDDLSSDAMAEMREDEPDQYIRLLEKQTKRKEFLEKSRANAKPESKPAVNRQESMQQIVKNNSHWLADGKETKAYKTDIDNLNNYYEANKFTQDQVDAFAGNPVVFQAMLKAAKLDALGSKNAVVEKLVRKAPVSTKPRSTTGNKETDEIKQLTARVKQTGNPADFAKLRQLQRKLKQG